MHGHVSAVLAEKGRQVYTVARGESVRDAVHHMNDSGVGALLVTEGAAPVGIFTERDVLRRVVDVGRDPNSTRVDEVMTADLIVVEPSTTIDQAMAVMTQRRCRHLPVVDEGRVVGMVSIGDLIRWVSLEQEVEIQYLVEYIQGRRTA
ncbi:MAG: CBS domain-containing protein [Thermoflexaceae bacterium]|nr:CBS domain-containing protein [Thermoflexaceae bacterium]